MDETLEPENTSDQGEMSGWKVIGTMALILVLAPIAFFVMNGIEKGVSGVVASIEAAPPLLHVGQSVSVTEISLGCRNKGDAAEFWRLYEAYGHWGAANEFGKDKCRFYAAGLKVRVIETDIWAQRVCVAQKDEYPCNWVSRERLKL